MLPIIGHASRIFHYFIKNLHTNIFLLSQIYVILQFHNKQVYIYFLINRSDNEWHFLYSQKTAYRLEERTPFCWFKWKPPYVNACINMYPIVFKCHSLSEGVIKIFKKKQLFVSKLGNYIRYIPQRNRKL